MKISIKETLEAKRLSLIDPKSGLNYISSFLGMTNAITDEWYQLNAENDCEWMISLAEYEKWANILEKEQNIVNLMAKYNQTTSEEFGANFEDDLEDELASVTQDSNLLVTTRTRLHIIERVVNGRVTFKKLGSITPDGAYIGRAFVMSINRIDDDTHNIDCDGTFVFTTENVGYEIPITLIARYKESEQTITLYKQLECPVALAGNQFKEIVRLFFIAIKKELDRLGYSGVDSYEMADLVKE